ncbi:hypothetical protein A3G67_02825 [Candidatus Roizmanbacteria bacterium RIFCSPLOWO2_12_FULL_40_12]|uniref:Uncharacterized protein n=1 Tax=Candidatus Roizmanbacteria bacterium RIFCSPLOWO2_01_FULL_40_42 TaxID=1802066 RepID=A0A1F7J2N6_9BACT|nr:MAG: hypothetical protein A2779_00355 [Candidatus Roizmanbacteria bacterium RIFCSPHIGHO2_01_FULL_40_98]OGK27511.1 MAG: hypothetical protein A3C31_03510 [Candidatus Roizmanbacteria bacterium RIFCSPHIGHO2_02_FULL_40_53]OGK30267.1 MAG: hypothetical protein A2W49_00995 [Candidatus Roizmanbacteria bacterium RIFCSPHIGHO2_12_41_18]OGK37133.1 MAG: hypothetical protein A3E69_01600 [Candidatus Roizmanbacteria bacterium RIFCSPHIGHO2_12_FULL_40_130]OGK49873.1 MAG: hypothetical protein A3B50_03750 [Candi
MITNDDIKKLKRAFVTKDYLDKRLDDRFDRFEKYMDYRFQTIEEILKELLKFNDFATDKLDWLVGKYQKFEDERMILTTQYSSVNKRLDVHETDVKILKKKIHA